MKSTVLLSSLALSTALAFAACSSDEDGPAVDVDAGGSSGVSSSSGGESSSSGGGSSSGGSSSSSSSSSSGATDAGSDASACTAAEATAASEQLALAVTHAREFLDGAACDTEFYPVNVAEDVQRAIDSCADARAAYADDPANEDARNVLAGTITSGILAGKPFAEALVGSRIWGNSPGSFGPPYKLTFTDATRVTSQECTLNDDDDFECEDRLGTYTIDVTGGTTTLRLDFLNAPLTPDTLRVTPDTSIAAPAFRFEAEGDFEDAYTFEELCSG